MGFKRVTIERDGVEREVFDAPEVLERFAAQGWSVPKATKRRRQRTEEPAETDTGSSSEDTGSEEG